MKKIRTANGGILFLEDKDYMPKLLAYLREAAGNDAAELVEEWANEEKGQYIKVLADTEHARFELTNRCASLERDLCEAHDEHLAEIEELEEELTRIADVKDILQAENCALYDLINNPEKLFPEIGTKVFRFVDKALSEVEHGRIDAYKLRKDARTRRPEFFVRISWAKAWGNGFISDPYWYKFQNMGKSFHVGDPTYYVKDAVTAGDVIEEAEE